MIVECELLINNLFGDYEKGHSTLDPLKNESIILSIGNNLFPNLLLETVKGDRISIVTDSNTQNNIKF